MIDTLALNWIAIHGVPDTITTDRGSQFTSQIWTQLLKTWGIQHNVTTAYHPQSNGLVERLHRRLKESLMALCQDKREKWFWKLPMALLTLRTTIKPDIGASPSEMVFGEGISVPGQLVGPPPLDDDEMLRCQRSTQRNSQIEVECLQPKPTAHHRRAQVHIPEDLATATHVLVLRGGVQPSLTAPYDGPFPVLERKPSGFRIQFPGRQSDIVSLARLKPAFVSRDGQQANDDSDQDLDDHIPNSPPPPGRRPGPRMRHPQPTSRVTRSQRNRVDFHQPTTSAAACEPTCAQPSPTPSRVVTQSSPDPSQGDNDNDFPPASQSPPPSPVILSRPSHSQEARARQIETSSEMTESNQPQNQGGEGKKTHSFSRPKPGNFSYRRRRPDINALREILNSIH